MTLKDVEECLDEIRRLAEDDYEAAHGRESILWESALVAIKRDKCEGCTPKQLAEAVLKSRRIEFSRYTA